MNTENIHELSYHVHHRIYHFRISQFNYRMHINMPTWTCIHEVSQHIGL